MAKKSFERRLVDWFESTKEKAPNDAYNFYFNLLKEEMPEGFEVKKPGRISQNRIIGFRSPYEPNPERSILELYSDMELAKLAVCIDKLGYWEENDMSVKEKYETLINEFEGLERSQNYSRFCKRYKELSENKEKKRHSVKIIPYPEDELAEDLKSVEFLFKGYWGLLSAEEYAEIQSAIEDETEIM